MNTIYKAFNKITGKSYIGFDSAWPNRKERHQENAMYSREGKFYDSIRKHGWETFEWSIIYQSKDKHHTLNIMEPHFIREYDTFNYGYNMTEGGEGCFGATTNKLWINDGHRHKRIEKTETIPQGWNLGRIGLKRQKKMSDESKKLIGQKNKKHGVIAKLNQTLLTCPHCGKTSNVGIMRRWHFEKCNLIVS